MREPGEPIYRIFRGSDIGAAYRVVERCPPKAEDFNSYAAAGGGFPFRMFFRATGVSMYMTREAAARWAHNGQAAAELDLTDEGIYVAVVSPPSEHLVVWGPPATLLGCLLSCENAAASASGGAAGTPAYLVVDNASRNVLHAADSLEGATNVYFQLVAHDPQAADQVAVFCDGDRLEQMPNLNPRTRKAPH